MIYDIRREYETVGHAQVSKKGLYYEISCRDSISALHTIEMCCAEKQINLGICVPIGAEFGFCTQIPIKRVGAGPFQFRAILVKKQEQFATVREDKPFADFSRLKDAYLCKKGNKVGIIFRSEAQDR